MKTINITSLILFLVVVLFAVFLGGKEINSAIQESIDTNVKNELQILKDKISQQSELINSILTLNNKTNDNISNNDRPSNQNSSTTSKEEDKIILNSQNVIEFTYIKENGGITITGYTGKQTSVVIPETIEQRPVLKIGEEAFANTKIKSITLPSSCIEIDWFAFYGCYALTTIHIGDNTNNIGYGAFDSCSKSLTIYCSPNSYAQKYAKSFGINYSLPK